MCICFGCLQGLGDMAVSNAIGSNVFDILLCLGLPWFLKTAVVSRGSAVPVYNKGLTYSLFILTYNSYLPINSHLCNATLTPENFIRCGIHSIEGLNSLYMPTLQDMLNKNIFSMQNNEWNHALKSLTPPLNVNVTPQ